MDGVQSAAVCMINSYVSLFRSKCNNVKLTVNMLLYAFYLHVLLDISTKQRYNIALIKLIDLYLCVVSQMKMLRFYSKTM